MVLLPLLTALLRMQYVEIYNEAIKDLIEPGNASLDVREAPGRGTFVAGAAVKGGKVAKRIGAVARFLDSPLEAV